MSHELTPRLVCCCNGQGMRCGDTSKNGQLSQRMARAREIGNLPPIDWTPPDRRERYG